MTFYKCPICGKIIVMVEPRNNPTICCGRPMEELPVNTEDGAHEKHIPVFTQKGNIVHVKVGEVEHPMVEAHHISWILLQTNLGNQRKVLDPLGKPEASFALLPNERLVAIYEYCNLHGLYKAE